MVWKLTHVHSVIRQQIFGKNGMEKSDLHMRN